MFVLPVKAYILTEKGKFNHAYVKYGAADYGFCLSISGLLPGLHSLWLWHKLPPDYPL
jgi:hypothetical protein